MWLVSGIVCGVLVLAIYNLVQEFESLRLQRQIRNRYTPEVLNKPKEIKEEPIATEAAKMRLPIIMYHYIDYIIDPNDKVRNSLTINPANFANQLQHFKDVNYQTYFVRDVPGILEGKVKSASRSAVLTFDDGYEDFYTYAFPILKKYNMKATVYIIVNFIGKKGFLSDREIKTLLASGLIEIGSHTFDHAYLKRTNAVVAKRQIIESKKVLENEFGIKVKTFAYPYGAFDNQAMDLVKEASYSAAVSVISGTMQSTGNVFYLSRLRPGFLVGSNMISALENFPR